MSAKVFSLPRKRWWIIGVVTYVVLSVAVRAIVPAPEGTAVQSSWYPAEDATLLIDQSWIDENNNRVLQQTLFDAVLQQIARADRYVLVDMFLFNDWQGPTPETHRALTQDLTNALVSAAKKYPEMPVVVITDPVNTVYGGVSSVHLNALVDAGVSVATTPLPRLQDSNPLYSSAWRFLIQPFGNTPDVGRVPGPFGDFDVTVRSWLALLNFKANHRKLLVSGQGSTDRAIVSSANPHDGSSAHRNIGLQFSGQAVQSLLASELTLLQWVIAKADFESTDQAERLRRNLALLHDRVNTQLHESESTEQPIAAQDVPPIESAELRVLTESAIRRSALAAIDTANRGDSIKLLMFYLSHREIVTALKSAAQRGVNVQVLLDANKDAFGRAKDGVPNRPVAHELRSAGVDVRWCSTQGEQCHAKVLYTRKDDTSRLILGSGNYTRRNLDDFNLETNVDLKGPSNTPAIEAFIKHFDQQWNNRSGRQYSTGYETYADDSLFKTWKYRFMEATGLSTF